MISRTTRLGLLFSALTLAITAPLLAQSSQPNCAAVSAETEADDVKIARTWLPLAIAYDAMQGVCEAHNFLGRVFTRQPDPEKITAEDVFEVSRPASSASGDATFEARLRKLPSAASQPGWNPQPTPDPIIFPPPTLGGSPSLFQPNQPLTGEPPTSIAEVEGKGTLVTPQGMKRGTFEDGKLNGVGEEIGADGMWRGGTYEAGRNISNLFEVATIDGKTYLAVGSIVDGKVDGMVERVFADGSRQFEDWENGKLMQTGVRVPKGQSPIAPQVRKQEVAARQPAPVQIIQQSRAAPIEAPAPPAARYVDHSQGYATQIANPGLPPSFYARYSGRNLSQAECNNQANELGWASRMNAMSRDDTILLLRATIASSEAVIVITRQCENLPGAKQAMDSFANTRNAAISTCRSISTDPGACLRSPF